MTSSRRAVCLLALAAVLPACGTASSGMPAAAPGADEAASPEIPWVREIDPFPVERADGSPYEMPFLGGFDVPRPQLVDIDGDGDDDLFVQEETNRLLFFEAEPAFEGTGETGLQYRYRPDRFDELEIGEWYRFADADGDGDPDLFAEQPFSYVRLYRNVGDAERPEFEVLADTLRDTRGTPIFSDRQNIPNVADIDCDGRLDLLVGRLVGTITRYEATDVIGTAVAPFEHITDRFENIEIVADPAAPREEDAPSDFPGAAERDGGVSPRPGGAGGRRSFAVRPTLHGANTMALVDIDQDGDVDLFWGDFFEPGLLFIENRGTCERPDLSTSPVPFPPGDPLQTSGYNAPTFGDLDWDGDLDLLVGVLGGAFSPNTTLVENLIALEQDDAGVFHVRTRRFVSQLDVGSESVPRLADLDADGDLDLVVGSRVDPNDLDTSMLRWFENVGSAGAPAFREVGTMELEGAYHSAPAFGNLSADGDLDLILGTWESELRLFEGRAPAAGGDRPDGGPVARFDLTDPAIVELSRGSNATPTLGDLDADGDLDLIVGEASGTLNLFENVGGPGDPRFELASDEYADIDVGRRSVPVLVDLDGDGDLDLVVGSESEGILYFRNRGGRSDADFAPAPSPFPSPQDLPAFAAPALGDLDGDGSLELVVGGAGGGLHFFRVPERPAAGG